MKKGKVKFKDQDNSQFYNVLRKRVDNFFKDNNLSQNANTQMKVKTVILLMLYILPYALIITGWFSPMQMLPLLVIMGLGCAGVGFSVMHDAVHGSYSSNQKVNSILSYTMYALGGSIFIWRVQHNIFHHTYTNIYKMDEDLDAGYVLRFSPNAVRKPHHYYQQWYAFILYSFITFSWVFFKDFHKLAMYKKIGVVNTEGEGFTKELLKLILFKSIYLFLVFAVPYMMLNVPFWQIIIGFFIVHMIASVTLSTIFQLAHIIEDTKHPKPNDNGDIENAWAIHQLRTTANFANNNRLLTWFAGGLNFQVEHHLFPKICHIHYAKVSKIVKETADEYGLPYNAQPTFLSALMSHIRMLKEFGRKDNPEVLFAA